MIGDANERRSATALAALTSVLFAVLVAAVSQPELAADPTSSSTKPGGPGRGGTTPRR